MIPDLYCTDLLETALHDEIQGIEALSCAFGLSHERVETIIAEEPNKEGTCWTWWVKNPWFHMGSRDFLVVKIDSWFLPVINSDSWWFIVIHGS